MIQFWPKLDPICGLGQHSLSGKSYIVGSHKVAGPRDSMFIWSYRSEIWQAPRQHSCRGACQIPERSQKSKPKSRGFEVSRDPTIRRLVTRGLGHVPWDISTLTITKGRVAPALWGNVDPTFGRGRKSIWPTSRVHFRSVLDHAEQDLGQWMETLHM